MTREAEIVTPGGNHLEEQRRIDKSLAPFSDNLPYDMERVVQYGKFQLEQALISVYEVGKCLLLLYENESAQTFAQVLAEHFGCLPLRTAQYYMRFARFAGQFPRFRSTFERPRMLSKGMALIGGLKDPEVEAMLEGFEDTGQWGDLSEDDILEKSVREMKRENKKLREQMAEGQAKAEKEKEKLKEEVADLKLALNGPDLEATQKLLEKADKKIHEAVQLLRQIPWAAVGREALVREELHSRLEHLRGVADNVEREVMKFAEDTEEQIAAYDKKLRRDNARLGAGERS